MKREPELQAFWDEERIYERLLEDNDGEKFVLHDGPPYANGDLHIGHALNKVRRVLSIKSVLASSCDERLDDGLSGSAVSPGAYEPRLYSRRRGLQAVLVRWCCCSDSSYRAQTHVQCHHLSGGLGKWQTRRNA